MALTAADIEAQLGDAWFAEQARRTRIISLALPGGVAMFGAVVVLIAVTRQGGAQADPGPLLPFTLTTLFITAAGWAASFVVPRRMIQPERLRQAWAEDPARAMGLLRASRIVRLALREGPALVGLVSCMIAVTGGLVSANPWVLIDALPAVAFVLVSLATLPSSAQLRGEVLEMLLLA